MYLSSVQKELQGRDNDTAIRGDVISHYYQDPTVSFLAGAGTGSGLGGKRRIRGALLSRLGDGGNVGWNPTSSSDRVIGSRVDMDHWPKAPLDGIDRPWRRILLLHHHAWICLHNPNGIR